MLNWMNRKLESRLSEVKLLSHVWLFATLWTVAHQAPPSMGSSRQEYWSGLPLPSRLWKLAILKSIGWASKLETQERAAANVQLQRSSASRIPSYSKRSDFCFIRPFNWLDKANPYYRGQPGFTEDSPSYISLSSKNIFTETFRIMSDQISRHCVYISSWVDPSD